MDEEYDVVVCGTGFKECILSGLLSTQGKKVLHVDRNPYYGGESASLNLTNLFRKFRGPDAKPPTSWGMNRDWNIDLIPKFIMANGKLVKMLIKTGVKDYLEFQIVEGTYVFHKPTNKGGLMNSLLGSDKSIHKVPASDTEALKSPLIPYTEKLKGRSFFQFIAKWNRKDSSTWGKFDPEKTTMEEVFKSFGIQPGTADFVGHAIALYTTDDYMKQPMGTTMDRLRLYMQSLVRYGSSPFIYPMYGLGTLPEGFSRLSAVYGGVYMLDTEVRGFEFDASGKVTGVRGPDGQVARCKQVICDPSYVLDYKPDGGKRRKVKQTAKVVRGIYILNGPIPSTSDVNSCQIILTSAAFGRPVDTYIAMVSSTHGVCARGKYVAYISTTLVGDEDKNVDQVLAGAKELLGPIEDEFLQVSDYYVPCDDGKHDNIYVTSSYDATSHFESAADDVIRVWKNLMGEDLEENMKDVQAHRRQQQEEVIDSEDAPPPKNTAQ